MGKQKKKEAIIPPALTMQVVCSKGHKLSGLFVIFKLIPPKGDSKTEKLAHVLEATPHPGEAPKAPIATGDKKKDTAANNAYKKRKTAYDDAFKKYEAAVDKETPPDPADQFVLGIVDEKGYLQPVHAHYNPWYDIATDRDPDAYKLAVGEKYRACFLRHPSPAVARALTRYLNEETAADDEKYRFDTWGELTREVAVQALAGTGGDHVAFKLSEDAEDYVPKGSDTYGKWMLYRDMPHAACETVAPHVEQVQKDIAMLRYPVGNPESPFKPKGDGFDGQVQAAVARLQEHVNEGKSFVLTHKDKAHGGKEAWSYVLGTPFEFSPSTKPESETDANRKKLRWAPLPATSTLGVVDAEMAAVIKHWIDNGLRKPAEILVDSITNWSIWMLERGCIALDAWTELAKVFGCQYGIKPGSSFRSVSVAAWPGAILNSVHKTGLAVDLEGGGNRNVSSGWPIRYEAHWKKNEPEAKQALTTAETALKKANEKVDKRKSLEKSLTTETIAAKIKTIQKQLDSDEMKEADQNQKAAQKQLDQVKADDADGKIHWKQRWRVYGHSDLDVFNDKAWKDEIARLKTAIAAWAGVPWPPPDPAATSSTPRIAASAPPRGKLWKTLKKEYFKDLTDDEVKDWLDKVLLPYVAYANQLLGMTPEELIRDYFRSSVVQFTPNAYESDGGTCGKKYGPTDADAEFPGARFPAKSWVNLSALGYPCQMERIPPHGSSIRDQTWILGPKHKNAAPKDWPMDVYFTVQGDEDKDIVVLLSDITATEAEAPQLKQRETDVPILRGGAIIKSYKPAEIDGPFVKSWRAEAKKFDAARRPHVDKAAAPGEPKGAQIGLVLSVTEKGKAPLQAVFNALGGTFKDKSFVVVYAGALAKVDVGLKEIITGKALSDKLKKGLEDFTTQATANAKKAEEEATKKADEEKKAKEQDAKEAEAAKKAGKKPPKKPTKTRAQIAEEKAAAAAMEVAAAKKLVTDWTVVIQPVFVKKPDPALLTFLPEDSVRMPPGSNANHLEWWHFQHRTAGPNWGTLLKECGYSLAVLGTPGSGNPDADGGPVHRGLLSYTNNDFASHPGQLNEGPVENRDIFTPAGG